MARNRLAYRVEISYAWWFWPYMYIVAGLSALLNVEPNWDRVTWWIDRAIKPRLVPISDEQLADIEAQEE